jgi:hypothetical protein
MAHTKIATCCYCGTRAALTLRGPERHELACGTCGAPLHEMKALKSKKDGKKDKRQYAVSHAPHMDLAKPKKARKSKKKRKSLASRFFDEAWDVLEDIFD